ncbi:MAG: prolipoprotein diacylglyceryl transferase, partial [Myxococcota bacterium]|nr:prolipoprotein diacylglyceryl transferase [Myxococcota bacterium]
LGVYAAQRRGRAPSGAAFLAWIVVYAIGRATVETLRADADRGLYAGASSAQWTSAVLVVAALAALVALGWGRGPRRIGAHGAS